METTYTRPWGVLAGVTTDGRGRGATPTRTLATASEEVGENLPVVQEAEMMLAGITLCVALYFLLT